MAYLDRRNNMNSERFLNALGLTRTMPERFSDSFSPALLFGAGILLGAGVALVLAPKSGRELRGDLSRQANQLGERVRERMPALPTNDKDKQQQQTWESSVST
jgi:hypothetical protein